MATRPRERYASSAGTPAVDYLTDLHVQTDRMAARQLLFALAPRILADHGHLIARTLDRAGERAWQKRVVPEAELVTLEAGRRGEAGSMTQVASL